MGLIFIIVTVYLRFYYIGELYIIHLRKKEFSYIHSINVEYPLWARYWNSVVYKEEKTVPSLRLAFGQVWDLVGRLHRSAY